MPPDNPAQEIEDYFNNAILATPDSVFWEAHRGSAHIGEFVGRSSSFISCEFSEDNLVQCELPNNEKPVIRSSALQCSHCQRWYCRNHCLAVCPNCHSQFPAMIEYTIPHIMRRAMIDSLVYIDISLIDIRSFRDNKLDIMRELLLKVTELLGDQSGWVVCDQEPYHLVNKISASQCTNCSRWCCLRHNLRECIFCATPLRNQ
jgi:hypothetical protein